jgi:hypothetical protein
MVSYGGTRPFIKRLNLEKRRHYGQLRRDKTICKKTQFREKKTLWSITEGHSYMCFRIHLIIILSYINW